MISYMFTQGKKCFYGVIRLNLRKYLFMHRLQECNPRVNHDCTLICYVTSCRNEDEIK
jgi:hypothetical protein